MLIFSNKYYGNLQSIVNDTFTDIDRPLLTNSVEVFQSSLTKYGDKIILDFGDIDTATNFIPIIPTLQNLMQTGAIKAIIMLGLDGEEEVISSPLTSVKSQTLVVVDNDTPTDASLKKMLLDDSPNFFYTMESKRNAPISTGGSSFSKVDEKCEAGYKMLSGIYNNIQGEFTDITELKEVTSKVSERTSKIVESLSTSDPNFPSRTEMVTAIGNIVSQKVILDNLPKIVDDVFSVVNSSTSELTNELREALNKKEVLKDTAEINDLVSQTRKTYVAATAEFKDNQKILIEATNLLASIQLPSQERIVQLSGEVDGFLDKQEIIEILELLPILQTRQDEVRKDVGDKLRIVYNSNTKLQASFADVVKGYEKAVSSSLTLVDKIMASKDIKIVVNTQTEKYVSLVVGHDGTGVTNYTACTSVSLAQDGYSCVIDLKESRPQLHHYAPNSRTLDYFKNKSADAIGEFIEEHYENNSTLYIPFPNINEELKDMRSKSQYKLLLNSLLIMLANKGVNVLVIADYKSTLFNYLAKKVAIVSIVSDTNIYNLTKLRAIIDKCKSIANIQQLNLVVTQISTIQAATCLANAGISVNGARVAGIPYIPTLDDYKLRGSIYAYDYQNWRF